MLARLVEQRDAIILVLTASPYGVENLTSDQWTTVVDLLSTLEPLINITQLMTLSSYPPLSLVLPALVQLRQALISMSDGVEALRDVLRRLVDEHFGDVFEDDDLCAASVLGSFICYYSLIQWAQVNDRAKDLRSFVIRFNFESYVRGEW